MWPDGAYVGPGLDRLILARHGARKLLHEVGATRVATDGVWRAGLGLCSDGTTFCASVSKGSPCGPHPIRPCFAVHLVLFLRAGCKLGRIGGPAAAGPPSGARRPATFGYNVGKHWDAAGVTSNRTVVDRIDRMDKAGYRDQRSFC